MAEKDIMVMAYCEKDGHVKSVVIETWWVYNEGSRWHGLPPQSLMVCPTWHFGTRR
jgi:hypothetical protein